jgi:hypothetical protein
MRLATGVAHWRIRSVSDTPGCITSVVVVERAEERESVVTAVGQDEDSQALLGRSHVRSTNGDARPTESFFLESVEDALKISACGPAHVLPEESDGAGLFDDAEVLPEEPRLFAIEAGALPCDGEILTGRATNDEIHRSAPRSSVEGRNVVPHRRFRQGRFLHPRHEAGRCVGFPLDVHHSAGPALSCLLDGEIESASSAEERDNTDFGTWSHMIAFHRFAFCAACTMLHQLVSTPP